METLDNPVWWSLQTEHESVAQRAGEVARYPSSYAPFIAVADAEADASGARELVGVGEPVYFLGAIPQLDARHWKTLQTFEVLQFVGDECDVAPAIDEHVAELFESDRPAMLGLAQEVYPFFFRADTASLGRYLGYRHEGSLIAMGGERMRLPDHQELSTVCIRPEFARSGIATTLFYHLVSTTIRCGRALFAHCVRGNQPVLQFSERMLRSVGGRLRAELPMSKVVRTA